LKSGLIRGVVPWWEWPYKRVLMVYDDNATLNNISVILWHSVLLMEETTGLREPVVLIFY
jgi:hypothetical protein